MTKKTSVLKLPTIKAFDKLSFAAKAKLFLAWVQTQTGEYNPSDNYGCALSRFGAAILGKERVYAGNLGFAEEALGAMHDVFDIQKAYNYQTTPIWPIWNVKQVDKLTTRRSTFKGLANRMKAYIKLHYSK